MLSGDDCKPLMTPAVLLSSTTVPGRDEETEQGVLSDGQSFKVAPSLHRCCPLVNLDYHS